MAITKSQKASLEAAGYSVKGNTVLNKSGQSVGGYNENGQIWSGSQKVTSILKSKDAPAPKAAPAAKAKASAKKASSGVKPISKPEKITSKKLPDTMQETSRKAGDNARAMGATAGVGRADTVSKAIKRKQEPVASSIYDKVYGADKWKAKDRRK